MFSSPLSKAIFILVVFAAPTFAFAQSDTAKYENIVGKFPDEQNRALTVLSIEQPPQFPGGINGWVQHLINNLHYPVKARRKGIQGRVLLKFIVEKDGSITGVHVLEGIGGGCDKEAIRVIEASPKWKPGYQDNHPVRVEYTAPIVFSLD